MYLTQAVKVPATRTIQEILRLCTW